MKPRFQSFHFLLIHFLLLPLLFLNSCQGQEKPTSSEKQVAFNPLPFPNVESLKREATTQIAEYVIEAFEDSKGHLWFGTMAKGAVCFDGKTLIYYSVENGLVDNTVASIREDQEGNIWFGTHNGASKFDGKTFTNFKTSEGLTGMGCQILEDKNGNIWAGTNHGVFRFDGSVFSKFDLPKPELKAISYKWELGKVWSMMEDSKGHLWFGRDGYGACRYDGNTFTHFTKKDGLCSNNISNIKEDVNGNIWFGSLSSDFPKFIKEGGLSLYDGKNIIQFPQQTGLSQNDIYTIYTDKKGQVWIGAIGHGAYRYDGQQFSFFNKTNREDLTKRYGIQSILEDQNGTLWFGFSGGLFRLEGNIFKNVVQEDFSTSK